MSDIKTAACLPGIEDDRKDWLLCAGRSRESSILEDSNFVAILKHLGGESDTLEVHRFGHWAVGWIEEMLVAPSRMAEVKHVKEQLDNYPVWDEDDFGDRENSAAFESWTSFGCKEFADAMQNEFDLMESTHALLMKSPDWTLHVFENNEPYALVTEGESVLVRAYGGQTKITREQMATMLRLLRKEIRNHV